MQLSSFNRDSDSVESNLQTMLREELSQARARMLVMSVVLLFFLINFHADRVTFWPLILLGSFALFSYCWMFLIQRHQADYPWRRRFIALFDISMLAYAMLLTAELGTIFYFLYLWIIVGNGIRFGVRSLLEVMLMGIIGFLFVIANSDYWLSNSYAAFGLFIGLIILPLFYLNLIKRLHLLNEKLNEELGKATYAATHDVMTDLSNRHYFFSQTAGRINQDVHNMENFAILFIDLDGFKEVNDSFGHHYGDELLKQIGVKLQSLVREGDVVARLGGDEFAILTDAKSIDHVRQFAERLITEIDRQLFIKNKEIHVTASVGISLYPQHGKLADSLVKAADTAMYQSKKSGKNQATFFVGSLGNIG